MAEHLYAAPSPGNVAILDEDSLLVQIDNRTVTGLVISGKGGIGKSRLTLELGWKALRKGWAVMRVESRLKSDALERLAEQLSPHIPALLLVDYIETQSDFLELVENIYLLNDTGVARIGYVAACRTGYYHEAVGGTARHLPLDLSPPPGDAAAFWFKEYRCESVKRILARAGLTVTAQHLAVCHDLPILAVFLTYLHTLGRTEELAELLREAEFGRWIARRVQLSFSARDVSRALALLVPLFPMTDAAADRLESVQLRPVFERLATDGWIERVTPSEPASSCEWVTAHDVLADQILIAYLRSIPNTAEAFVAQLLSLATKLDCLASALIALQRIADAPPLNAVPWGMVITKAIEMNENAWRKVRSLLIRTTPLSVPEGIALLNKHKGLWTDAEREIDFHNALGWFCRWLAITRSGIDSATLKQELTPWVIKAALFAERSNFVLSWGLRLVPEALAHVALKWIANRPTLFQTHYLVVAWLQCHLPVKEIGAAVQSWCQKFSSDPHLSFVAEAWLDAGGDKTVVEQPIRDWLGVNANRTGGAASHVYRAWLEAGGDNTLVEQPIRDWLGVEANRTGEAASHVYKAWLDAGGERNVVWDSLLLWLTKYRTNESAVYVTHFVARHRDLPEASVKDVLAWCRAFPAHEDVLWRVTQLGSNLLNVDVLEDACATAETLLSHTVDSLEEVSELARGQVTTLLCYLVDAAKEHSSKMRDRLDRLIVLWMRYPASFGRKPKPHANIQRIGFARRVLLLLDSGELNIARDKASVQRFLEWIDEWEVVWKRRLHSSIEVYSTRYPAPEAWSIVRLEEPEE